MIANMMRAKVREGRLDDMVAALKNEIVPAASQEPGFVRAEVFVDAQGRQTATYSFWENAESLQALVDSGKFQALVGRVMEYVEEIERSVYEVVS